MTWKVGQVDPHSNYSENATKRNCTKFHHFSLTRCRIMLFTRKCDGLTDGRMVNVHFHSSRIAGLQSWQELKIVHYFILKQVICHTNNWSYVAYIMAYRTFERLTSTYMLGQFAESRKKVRHKSCRS